MSEASKNDPVTGHRADPAVTHVEHAVLRDLHLVTRRSWAVVLAGALAVLFLFANKSGSAAVIATFAVLLAVGSWVAKRWSTVVAGWFFLVSHWGLMSVLALFSAGARSIFSAGYFQLVVVAGLFLGRRAAIGTAVASSVTLLGFAALEATGHLPTPAFPHPPFAAWAVLSLLLFATLAPLEGSLRILRGALRAVRESEQKYRFLTENVRDVIWVLDLETMRFTYVSPSVEQLRGYTAEEVMAQTASEALTPASAALLADLTPKRVAAFLRGETPNEDVTELEQPCRDGSTVWTEATSHFRRNAETGRIEVIGVSRNITQRKRLEEQLHEAQKMEAVGRLAGGVAHDFNNILAAMVMSFELLRDRFVPGSDDAELLEQLEGLAQRAAGLTRQLLMFGRRSMMQVSVVEVGAMLDGLRGTLERALGEKVTLSLTHDARSLHVEGDRSMLEQVLLDLVVNAKDAMPKGGHVAIHAAEVEVDAAHLAESADAREGTFTCLSVTDDGMGMDAATVSRVFEPFFTTKALGSGRGLGLAAVYGIVKQHGGWIELDSAPGRGSTFRIYLARSARALGEAPVVTAIGPAQLAAVSGASDRSRPAGTPAPSATVLLVEDEAMLRRALARFLRAQRYEVLEAGDGREALELWAARRSDIRVVLSDLMMPGGMTGLDLARRLRAEQPDLPLVLCTGYSTEALAPAADLGGHVERLSKPCEPRVIASKVRALLDAAEASP